MCICFSLSALGLIHLFFMMARHILVLPFNYIHLKGRTKMCLGIARHIVDRQIGSQGKKKQAILLYCLGTIRSLCLFYGFHSQVNVGRFTFPSCQLQSRHFYFAIVPNCQVHFTMWTAPLGFKLPTNF